MKKAGLLLLVLVILGGWAVKDSEAGQWCWQFETNPDVYIRLSVTKPDPLYPIWSLNGMWYAHGVFIIPVVGTMVKSADGTQRLLTLYGTFGADPRVANMAINAETKDGAFAYYDVLSATFFLGGNINKVNCSTLPAP